MILTPVRGGGSGSSAPQTVEANCVPTDAAGDVVYVSADKSDGRYNIAKVNIDHTDTWRAIGIGVIKRKLSGIVCEVQLSGLLEGVYTGLTPGRRMFADTNSRLAYSPPSVPLTGRRLSQKIAYTMAADVLWIAPEEPIALQQA